jgi:hypothetical protein
MPKRENGIAMLANLGRRCIRGDACRRVSAGDTEGPQPCVRIGAVLRRGFIGERSRDEWPYNDAPNDGVADNCRAVHGRGEITKLYMERFCERAHRSLPATASR